MRRPVWLFSMDSDQFHGPPMTTGALRAYFERYGATARRTAVELVHWRDPEELERWKKTVWPSRIRPLVRRARSEGLEPVFGFSCYCWNAAEFLSLWKEVKAEEPGILTVAGGPHVQQAEDFLGEEGLDVVVLGEGEQTFTELLDAPSREAWSGVRGLAFLDAEGRLRKTAPRPRIVELDRIPSALGVVALRDERGRPLYGQAAYETTRGCPYRCAFCEWGTGAIGTKMYQYSLSRIADDLRRLVAGGVQDLWLTDSNFGALPEDEKKAELVVRLRKHTGLPRNFSTSWSKNHNRRVQTIVRMLHREGLLSHYHLALQTLTPRALELSHRKNMRSNQYEPVVRSLAAEGVPVAAELIWGLPGESLEEFTRGLDHLMTVFPNINIFGYTLLPGTEFYERRYEYELETVPVAGYGKARGEYVVGSHTFSRREGEEGYRLVTAYIVLVRGHVIPLTSRYVALEGTASPSDFLRFLFVYVLDRLRDRTGLGPEDALALYENRARLYVDCLRRRQRLFALLREGARSWCGARRRPDLEVLLERLLGLDEAFAPREGRASVELHAFPFPADLVVASLSAMRRVDRALLLASEPVVLRVEYPGGLGDVVRDPDGGAWLGGRIAGAERASTPAGRPIDAASLL